MDLHNRVLNDQIWDFFKNDLESCLEVSKIKQEAENSGTVSPFRGGLNFTAATATFAVINFCASFYHGKRANTDETGEFMTKYFSKYWAELNDVSFSRQFYKVFRNGLSHQWSPAASGVAMDFRDKGVLLTDPSGLLHLNMPMFFEVVQSGLKDFESDLDSTPRLVTQFKKRYQRIIEQDEADLNKLKHIRATAEA